MFKDHFSENPAQYDQYRPHYPETLFQYLASISPANDKAWDCACGTGQAAAGLSLYFKMVVATDASGSQIAQATKSSRIRFEVARAEKTRLASGETDLITVAQALHWFDADAFFQEVGRVLKPNGILAVWTYNLLQIDDRIDQVIRELYDDVLGPYWPPERRMVENGYRDITFPFEKIQPPPFSMHATWDLNQLLGYLGTWSAMKRCKKSNLMQLELAAQSNKITALWGNADQKRSITWPLGVMVRRKSALVSRARIDEARATEAAAGGKPAN